MCATVTLLLAAHFSVTLTMTCVGTSTSTYLGAAGTITTQHHTAPRQHYTSPGAPANVGLVRRAAKPEPRKRVRREDIRPLQAPRFHHRHRHRVGAGHPSTGCINRPISLIFMTSRHATSRVVDRRRGRGIKSNHQSSHREGSKQRTRKRREGERGIKERGGQGERGSTISNYGGGHGLFCCHRSSPQSLQSCTVRTEHTGLRIAAAANQS